MILSRIRNWINWQLLEMHNRRELNIQLENLTDETLLERMAQDEE
jgi:hypothetical protein